MTDAAIRKRRLSLTFDATIRPARPADMRPLEWDGEFRHHREIIEAAFARHEQGSNLILVADLGGTPVGQAWLDFEAKAKESAALIWAVRVRGPFQNAGLGARIMAAAESAATARGFVRVELGVERANAAARRFYERLGYVVVRREEDAYGYATPEGQAVRHVLDQYVMRKNLRAA